jgi:hypothetical protein
VFNPPQQYLLVTTFGFQIALIVALIVKRTHLQRQLVQTLGLETGLIVDGIV